VAARVALASSGPIHRDTTGLPLRYARSVAGLGPSCRASQPATIGALYQDRITSRHNAVTIAEYLTWSSWAQRSTPADAPRQRPTSRRIIQMSPTGSRAAMRLAVPVRVHTQAEVRRVVVERANLAGGWRLCVDTWSQLHESR
jgi:hypothetical protein